MILERSPRGSPSTNILIRDYVPRMDTSPELGVIGDRRIIAVLRISHVLLDEYPSVPSMVPGKPCYALRQGFYVEGHFVLPRNPPVVILVAGVNSAWRLDFNF